MHDHETINTCAPSRVHRSDSGWPAPGVEMADPGRIVKMEVDYNDTVERRLPEVQEMAKVRITIPNVVYEKMHEMFCG